MGIFCIHCKIDLDPANNAIEREAKMYIDSGIP